jgi:hypothetical protein
MDALALITAIPAHLEHEALLVGSGICGAAVPDVEMNKHD